jgi:hypothetical protein
LDAAAAPSWYHPPSRRDGEHFGFDDPAGSWYDSRWQDLHPSQARIHPRRAKTQCGASTGLFLAADVPEFDTSDFPVPSKDRFTAWAAAEQKHTELQLRLSATERRRNEIDAERATCRSKCTLGGVQEEAAALLSGGASERLYPEKQRADEYASLRHEGRVLAEAIAMQEREVKDQRGQASIAIKGEVAPIFTRSVRRRAELLRELSAINDWEYEFRRLVEVEGFCAGSSMPPMVYMFSCNSLENHQSMANMWLKEAKEHGFIE